MKRKQKKNNTFSIKAICTMVFVLGVMCIQDTERQEVGEAIYNSLFGLFLIVGATYAVFKLIIQKEDRE